MQVHDLSAAGTAALRWPSGEGVPTVESVLAAVALRFRHITLDVKPPEQVLGELVPDSLRQTAGACNSNRHSEHTPVCCWMSGFSHQAAVWSTFVGPH